MRRAGREVAIVSFAQTVAPRDERDETEMLAPVIREAVAASGIPRSEIGFTVSGSCDFLVGRPFSFVHALDAASAWPPIQESHVEMDGAWALYEAWVRLQHGDIDSALVYAFGKSSAGSLRDVLVLQLDPYYLAPLWPDSVSLAALQARAVLDAGLCSERDLAEPIAQAISDGAAAVVLAAGDLARKVSPRPAWIRGIDHRIEPHALGVRDLTASPSTVLAAEKAGALAAAPDVAMLHAPFSHQEIILRRALGLPSTALVNRVADPFMVAGLSCLGEAARRILDGSARRAVAHATSGPCLQQNLVCLLEAD